MGIRILYIAGAIYGVASALGLIRHDMPQYYVYIFAGLLTVYYIFYAASKKIVFVKAIIGGMILNAAVQLTGGGASLLLTAYPIAFAIIAYREHLSQYAILTLCLCGIEILSAVFHHDQQIFPLVLITVAALVIGGIAKWYHDNEAYFKKILTKYESQEVFFSPLDIDHKSIVTSDQEIDKHIGIERPLLYFIKLVHTMFGSYSTAVFSYYNECLTMIKGFSHSELFMHNAVLDIRSGIYRQVIHSGKTILIKEFVQNPEELGYYKGEIKLSSVMIAPIVLGSNVEGILITDKREGVFTEDDRTLFESSVTTAGLLLAMIRLYESKSQEAKQLNFISDHAKVFHKELDLSKILQDAAQSFLKVMECNDVSIASIDELNETGQVLYSTCVKEKTTFSLDDGLVGFIARHRNYIIKEDLHDGNVVVFKKGTPTRNYSFIGVPVMQDDSLLGVVWLEDHRHNKFNADDVSALNILASQLSFAWQRANLHNQVKELSERDGLTGLYNHRVFQEKLEQELKSKHEVTLLLFDIDHFKKVNDTYGHQAGDKVLQFLSKLIAPSGIAARYGGEEFAIILPKHNLKQAVRIALSLKDHVMKSEIKHDQVPIKITVSIGIAHYPSNAATREDLIENADKALYRAKDNGRNRVELAKTVTE
ncbi:diguanylate cyclase [candidate division WOR-3 bacterium]|nr:diguanylate cyclase [candidate division WOR-3 bacterium]